MTGLPRGWYWSTVGEVGSVDLGRQRHPDWHTGPEMRPYLRVANVFEDHIDASDVKEMDFSGVFDRYKLEPGDVLLNEGQSPELLGRPAIYRGYPENAAFTNTLLRFRAGPHVLPEWALIVFRRHMHFRRFAREARITTNIAHLSASRFKPVEFPVPPLYEQRRIADILEDHLSCLDAAGQTISDSLGRLNRLRHSTLAQVLQSARSADTCVVRTIEDIALVGTGATPLKARRDYYQSGTIPWVTSADLAQGVISQPTQFITPVALAETNVKLFPSGTLLVAMYGEGKTRGTVGELAIAATTNQACAAIQLRDGDASHRAWVRLALEANYWHMRRLASGGVQPNLNLKLVRQIKVLLPDTRVRNSLLRFRDASEQGRRQLESELRRVKQRELTLKHALLAAAFSGRLTGRASDMEIAEETAGV